MRTASALKILAIAGMFGLRSGMATEATAESVKTETAYSATSQLAQLPAVTLDKTRSSTKAGSEGPKGFIFGAQDARHATNPVLTVRLGEKVIPQALKTRFAGYEVRYTKGEDCLTCATISGADGQIGVSFARDGRTVVEIKSYDARSRDAKGSQIGSSLTVALGSNLGNCDAGENTTCASPDLKGLLYIVAEDDRCPITVKEQQSTDIPACARIAGFQILAVDFGH